MAEQILLGFFWCSLASLVLVVWTSQPISFYSILSIILEFLSILKIFGIALLVITSLSIAIVIWEQLISNTQLWKKLSAKLINHSIETHYNPAETPSQDQPQDEQRSILPIVIVIAALGLFAILDTSFLHPSSPKSSTKDPRRDPTYIKPSGQNRSVTQFASAISTLALVVGLIVFNKDEYRTWKARRRILKQHRRRARQEYSLNSLSK